MKNAGIIATLLVMTVWGWIAGASAIFCGLLGRPFGFPCLQWLALAPLWWRANWFATLLIAGSALVSGVIVLTLSAAVTLFFYEGGHVRWLNRLAGGSNNRSQV